MALGIDPPALFRVIGGRRRYNAMRRRKAEGRRESLRAWLNERDQPEFETFMEWLDWRIRTWGKVFPTRGAMKEAARVFSVHRSTICRDIQRINGYGIPIDLIDRDGTFLCSFQRACQGGPVGRMYDAFGRRIKGAARRAMLRRIPRYTGRRSTHRRRPSMPTDW